MGDLLGAFKLFVYVVYHDALHYVFFLCYLLLALYVAKKLCAYKGKEGFIRYVTTLAMCFIPYFIIPVFYYGHFAFRCTTEAEIVVNETVELGKEHFDESPPYELKIERPRDDKKIFIGDGLYTYREDRLGRNIGTAERHFFLKRDRDKKIMVRIKAFNVSFIGGSLTGVIYDGMPNISCDPNINWDGNIFLYRKALEAFFNLKEE